jgi:hydroxyacylglutathione hydrolase
MAKTTLVIPVAQAPLNICKSFLLVGSRVVIVDTGPPGGDVQVKAAMQKAGFGAKDVSLILVTHSHPDHAANAAELRRWTGAPIAVDSIEKAYVEGRASLSRTPTGRAGRLFLLTPLPHQTYERFAPDLLVDDNFDLRAFGVEADVYRSGGHTPGSLSIYIPSTGELLAIDLLAGGILIGGICLNGRPIEPAFHEDRPSVVRALSKFLEFDGLKKIHVCHGGPLHPDKVRASMNRLARGLSQESLSLAKV